MMMATMAPASISRGVQDAAEGVAVLGEVVGPPTEKAGYHARVAWNQANVPDRWRATGASASLHI